MGRCERPSREGGDARREALAGPWAGRPDAAAGLTLSLSLTLKNKRRKKTKQRYERKRKRGLGEEVGHADNLPGLTNVLVPGK